MDVAGMCHQCGCKWDSHMHITYEQQHETDEVDDPEVMKAIEGNKSKEEIERKAIEGLNKTKDQWEKEQRRIVEIASKFGAFLKEYATVARSDAIREYIKLNIRDAEIVAASTKVRNFIATHW